MYTGGAKSHFTLLKINHVKTEKDRNVWVIATEEEVVEFLFEYNILQISTISIQAQAHSLNTSTITFLRLSGVRLRIS